MDMQRAYNEMKVEVIHFAFEEMFDDESLNGFIKICVLVKKEKAERDQISFVDKRYSNLLHTIKEHFGLDSDLKLIIEKFENSVIVVRGLNSLLDSIFKSKNKSVSGNINNVIKIPRGTNHDDNTTIFVLWLIISSMKDLFPEEGKVNRQNYVTEILLDTPIRKILQQSGKSEAEIINKINLLNLFLNNYDQMIGVFVFEGEGGLLPLLEGEAVRTYLGVNKFENVLYYNKENFEELLDWSFTFACLKTMNVETVDDHDRRKIILELFNRNFIQLSKYKNILKHSEYKLELLRESLLKQ